MFLLFRVRITSSSGTEAMKHKSRDPGTATWARGVNSLPHTCKVDLLPAELEGEALFGGRAELLQLHSQHLAVKAHAGVEVARGEHDMVDVVDQGDAHCGLICVSAG